MSFVFIFISVIFCLSGYRLVTVLSVHPLQTNSSSRTAACRLFVEGLCCVGGRFVDTQDSDTAALMDLVRACSPPHCGGYDVTDSVTDTVTDRKTDGHETGQDTQTLSTGAYCGGYRVTDGGGYGVTDGGGLSVEVGACAGGWVVGVCFCVRGFVCGGYGVTDGGRVRSCAGDGAIGDTNSHYMCMCVYDCHYMCMFVY